MAGGVQTEKISRVLGAPFLQDFDIRGGGL